MMNINQNIQDNLSNFHMAGLIPVSGEDVTSSLLPWHRCLLQLDQNLLAVERAVLECNFAGCESIWVICNEDIQPLVKHRIGDYVVCLESITRSKYVPFPQTKIENIPIFYVPIPARARQKRDSLAWTILHGAQEAFITSTKISKWLLPNKYYVSFPYGIYDPRIASTAKDQYYSGDNVFFTYNGLTIADGLYIGFTFSPADFKNIRNKVKEECTGFAPSLETKDRWSSRHFSLDKFYNYDNIKDVRSVDVEDYYSCAEWNSYTKYLQSDKFGFLSEYDLQKLNGFLKNKNERVK